MKLDDLIADLIHWRTQMGGECEIAIKDADTGWHMRIDHVRGSKTVLNRLLIQGASGYGDEDILPQ